MIVEKYILTQEMVENVMEANGLDTENEELLNDFVNQMALLLDDYFVEALQKATDETLKRFK